MDPPPLTCHGYIYVRRFGEFIGAPVRKQLKWLDWSTPPYWLLIFPEGTRLSAKKKKLLESSNQFLSKMNRKEMRNVLCPRSGGLQLALDNLSTLTALYDVTVMYGQTRQENRRGYAPGMFEFCCGPVMNKQLYIHIERFNANILPIDKIELRNWLIDRFYVKEKLIDKFHAESPMTVIDEDEEKTKLATIPITTTLPSTVFFCSALIAPFFSETVRKTYIYTIASSPLLIAWLHLRRCV